MKKKLFIFIIVFVVLITGVILFLFLNNKKEDFSILTIDINPSIEINLNKRFLLMM